MFSMFKWFFFKFSAKKKLAMPKSTIIWRRMTYLSKSMYYLYQKTAKAYLTYPMNFPVGVNGLK